MADRSRLKQDALLSSVGMLLSGGAQLVLSVVVGQVAGPAMLGSVRGALALANTASLLTPSAAGQTASLFVAREAAADNEPLALGVARHLAGRVALAMVVLMPVTAVAASLLIGATPADAAWVAALVLALGAYQMARGMRFGWGHVGRATLWEAGNTLLTLALLAAVLLARNPGWLLAPLVAGNLLYAIGAWTNLLGKAEHPGDELRRELDAYIRWGIVGTVASTGLMQMSMVIAKATATADGAGWYAAAVSLATPLSMLARALSMALFPEMARQRGRQDHAATRATTHRATWGLVAAMTPAFAALIAVSQPLMELVYGEAFHRAVPSLRVLLVAVLWSVVPVAATNSINVRGAAGVRLSAVLSWAGLVVGIAAIGILVGPLGIDGVALGYLAGATTTAVGAWLVVWRRDGHRWGVLSMWAVGLPVAAWWASSVSDWTDSWPGAMGLAVATLAVGAIFALVTRGARAVRGTEESRP